MGRRTTSKEYACQYCSKTFTGRANRPSKYCSRKCTNAGRTKHKEHFCEYCGKLIDRKEYYRHPQFCDQVCFTQSQRKENKCPQCGVVFVTGKTNKKKFCSSQCANRYNQSPDPTKKAIFTCVWCGKDFEAWAYRKPAFCSLHCISKYAARRPKPNLRRPENFVTLTCEVCSKEYTVHKVQTEGRNSRFCSVKCKGVHRSEQIKGEGNPNYIDGTSHLYPGRGLNWQEQRAKALRRDEYKCQVCDTSEVNASLDVHHIKPYRLFNDDWQQANQLHNLITLCRQCHVPVEIGKIPCPIPKTIHDSAPMSQ